jgi:hypothetical protein
MLRLFPFRLAAAAVAAATGLTVTACNSSTPTNPTPVETPTAVSETFEGTLTVNGAVTHPFVVQRAGTVTLQLSGLEPSSGVAIGASIGTWNGQVCDIKLANDAAVLNVVVTGTAATSGNFCARVYDVGKLTGPVAYQVVVTHF